MPYFFGVFIAPSCIVPAQQEEDICSQLIIPDLLHYQQLQFKLQFCMTTICN